MKLVKSKNAWSCLIASAAMVLDKHPDVLTELIGHDGSEIIFPDAREPARRRGFHVQEIIDCAHAYGYAVTPVEALPISTPDRVREYEVKFCVSNEERFSLCLEDSTGILTGRARQWGHAVAWDGSSVYDPRGKVTTFALCEMDIDIFWRFTKIISKRKSI